MLDNVSRRGHSVIDVMERARQLHGRDMWALVIPLFGDAVKVFVREKGNDTVLLYTECSGADALRLLKIAGLSTSSHELEAMVRELHEQDGLDLLTATNTVLSIMSVD